MAAKKESPLRAVEPGEAPPTPPKVMTLAEAIEDGDYLQILLAQRRDIVECLPEEKGPAKAAMHRQLSILSKEIEVLEARDKQTATSEQVADVDESFDAAAI